MARENVFGESRRILGMENTMQKYIWIVFVIAAVGYFLTYVLAGHYVKGLKDPYEEDLEEKPQEEKPRADSLQVKDLQIEMMQTKPSQVGESQVEPPQLEPLLETDKGSCGKTDA